MRGGCGIDIEMKIQDSHLAHMANVEKLLSELHASYSKSYTRYQQLIPHSIITISSITLTRPALESKHQLAS